jgi:hypothetical protein
MRWILTIGGGLVGLAILWALSRALFRLFYIIEANLEAYSGRHGLKHPSWGRMIPAVFGLAIILADSATFNEIDNMPIHVTPLIQNIVGGAILGIVFISILVKAKLHTPLALLVQIIGVPLNILYGIFYIICDFTGGIPEYAKNYIPVKYNPNKSGQGTAQMHSYYEDGELKHSFVHKEDSYYENGKWYDKNTSSSAGDNEYVSRD